jgi:ethanolamine ammonia-lyase small subunit
MNLPEPWGHLRRYTAARIAIGRTGGSQLTEAVLDFRLSHARARDAVKAAFDAAGIAGQLAQAGISTEVLETAAKDRESYLLRPDLGRALDEASRAKLVAGDWDLVVIISDGLSATAAEKHAAATLLPLMAELEAEGWKMTPVYLVPFGRVKVQDEIGAAVGARHSLILLGERPGLGTPDSLGAYLTADPSPEKTDADRNCVSNIRPEGLPPARAAAKLAWLLKEARRLGVSGVGLKDGEGETDLVRDS